jgi:hypothetical protein
MTKIRVAFFRRMLSATSAQRLGQSTSYSGVTRGDAVFHQPDCPLVLVACGAGARWDVLAKAFDNPLTSFDERPEACEYASDLAKARKNSIVRMLHRECSKPIEAT